MKASCGAIGERCGWLSTAMIRKQCGRNARMNRARPSAGRSLTCRGAERGRSSDLPSRYGWSGARPFRRSLPEPQAPSSRSMTGFSAITFAVLSSERVAFVSSRRWMMLASACFSAATTRCEIAHLARQDHVLELDGRNLDTDRRHVGAHLLGGLRVDRHLALKDLVERCRASGGRRTAAPGTGHPQSP